MKIAIYTIALNEEHNVERWHNSIKYDADEIIVADTGSTDRTVEMLRERGVTVHQITINPWRFDVARNAALAYVPEDVDVCISLDMDEHLDWNWNSSLKRAWKKDTKRAFYRYYFNGPDGGSFTCDKIHARKGYRWKRPVHENVVWVGEGLESTVSTDLKLIQQQTIKETRNSYLDLLKLAHEEDPLDAQIAFWYGRDLTYARQGDLASSVLNTYLKTSTWNVERSEAYRLLAKSEQNPERALFLALSECPRREVYADFADHYYMLKDWSNLYWACFNGLKTQRTQTYLDSNTNDLKFYDLGSLACYRLEMFQQACKWVDEAKKLNPSDNRLEANRRFMYEAAALGKR